MDYQGFLEKFCPVSTEHVDAHWAAFRPQTELHVPLTEEVNEVLYACTDVEGKTMEELVSDMLQTWAAKKVAESNALIKALQATPQAEPQNEKTIERGIAATLRRAGVKFETQVKCSIGTADLVVGDCVVEIKHRINSFRELHQAWGQAKGYAADMGLPRAMVTAQHFRPGLLAKAATSGVEAFATDDAIQLLIQSGY